MSPSLTIVIVPGAWQTPVAWDDFSARLAAAGFPTEYVALPTVGGTETPLAGLADDVAAVRAVLSRLILKEEREVVLLCHSAGGLVGSNAVEGLDIASRKGAKGGVVQVIYVSAFMIPQGKSLMDMLGGKPLPWMDVQSDRVGGVADLIPQVAFNDMPPDAQERWCKEMSHTSKELFTTPTGFEPWNNGVSCSYIFCAEDNALPLPIQQQMAAQLGPEPTTATLKSGHCPFLSMPDDLLLTVSKVIEAGSPTRGA